MVPTQTEFAHALAQPFDVIHAIIKRRDGEPQAASEPTDSDVVAHFRSLFHDPDRTAKIPALTPDSLHALLDNASSTPQSQAKLVRWRCMIQDTGFATEVYQSYQLDEDVGLASSSSQGASSVTYSAFGLDFTVARTSADAAEDGNAPAGSSSTSTSTPTAGNKRRWQQRRENEGLRERNVMYAVSVPGETSWARRAYGDANVTEASDRLAADITALSLGDAASSGSSKSPGKNPFSYKSPLPEEGHVSGMLKFYDVDGASAALQVTNVIEAVGILEATPFRSDDWQDLGFGMPGSGDAGGNSASATYNGPCLHVLFFTPLPPSTIPQALTEARTPSLVGMASAPEIRAGLLAYLTDALDGDELAAEFLLLALLARVHTRRNPSGNAASDAGSAAAEPSNEGVGIGGLSLNISGVPEDGPSSRPSAPTASSSSQIPEPPLPKLGQALRNLLPAVVDQPLALPHLNAPEVTLAPRAGAHAASGIDSGESLQAGRLQLPKGTLVLVDEVGMGDGGTLNEGGVRNLHALAGLLRTHRLDYEYPYHRLSFEADLRVVVLSAGKSFLPADVHVPLQARKREDVGAAVGRGQAGLPELAPDTLRLYRLHLLQARYAPFTIDEADGVAERISADFVDARRRAAAATASAKASAQKKGSEETALATQEDLLRRMSIARLLALSRSESKLSIDTWVRAGELDDARLERIRQLPLGRPAGSAMSSAR